MVRNRILFVQKIILTSSVSGKYTIPYTSTSGTLTVNDVKSLIRVYDNDVNVTSLTEFTANNYNYSRSSNTQVYQHGTYNITCSYKSKLVIVGVPIYFAAYPEYVDISPFAVNITNPVFGSSPYYLQNADSVKIVYTVLWKDVYKNPSYDYHSPLVWKANNIISYLCDASASCMVVDEDGNLTGYYADGNAEYGQSNEIYMNFGWNEEYQPDYWHGNNTVTITITKTFGKLDLYNRKMTCVWWIIKNVSLNKTMTLYTEKPRSYTTSELGFFTKFKGTLNQLIINGEEFKYVKRYADNVRGLYAPIKKIFFPID